MQILFLILVLIMSLLSCRKEEDLIQPEVDQRLKLFFESFKQESISRRQSINMDDIIGTIVTMETAGVLGRCNQSTTGKKHLMIDSLFWLTSTFKEKEYVIFHELGHCALNRRHLDTKNVDGDCISIMQSGNGSCMMNYNAQNRSKYLDELFSQ